MGFSFFSFFHNIKLIENSSKRNGRKKGLAIIIFNNIVHHKNNRKSKYDVTENIEKI